MSKSIIIGCTNEVKKYVHFLGRKGEIRGKVSYFLHHAAAQKNGNASRGFRCFMVLYSIFLAFSGSPEHRRR